MLTKVKTKSEVEAMRQGGKILAQVLSVVKQAVVPGVNTKELANLAAKELKSLGGEPAFLGFQGFPDVMCISLNDEVVHGIPRTNRIVREGDIVSLDFGVVYKGMITDAAISFVTGHPIDPNDVKLVDITKQSLMAGIKTIHDGSYIGDISAAVQAILDAHKYGIVRDLVGHGVGHQLHEDPNVPNFGRPGVGMPLRTNMTIAIEPMATLGGYHVYMSDDGWTVLSEDGSRAAHFEHTVLVTEDGAEILTSL